MGRLRPDEALATAHHRRPEGPEMWARPESSRGSSTPTRLAQDRQANACLHANSFAGRKNMEHEVRNVRVRNRVGEFLPLLDLG